MVISERLRTHEKPMNQLQLYNPSRAKITREEMHPLDQHFETHKRFYCNKLAEKTHGDLTSYWNRRLKFPMGLRLEDVEKTDHMLQIADAAILVSQHGINLDNL